MTTTRPALGDKRFCEAAEAFAKEHPQVEAIFLFGSWAKGWARAESDIDLAFLLDRTVPERSYLDFRLTAAGWFGAHLGGGEVEAVVLNEAGIVLRMEVVRHGVLLHARLSARVARFRSATLSEYDDTRRFRKRIQQALLRRIKEGRFGARPASDPGIAEEVRRIRRALAERRQTSV